MKNTIHIFQTDLEETANIFYLKKIKKSLFAV